MTVLRTFRRRARRLAAGAGITLVSGAGLLAAGAPAAHAAVPGPVHVRHAAHREAVHTQLEAVQAQQKAHREREAALARQRAERDAVLARQKAQRDPAPPPKMTNPTGSTSTSTSSQNATDPTGSSAVPFSGTHS